jgi:hypothetical protein
MGSARRTLQLTLGTCLLLAAACGDGGATVGGDAPEPTADAIGDALGDGEAVTVTGTVDDVFGDTAFTLTDAIFEEGTVGTEGDVTVIATDGADVSESEAVVVTGTLLSVDVADDVQQLEDLFGANVDDEVMALLDDQQVVIASSVGGA